MGQLLKNFTLKASYYFYAYNLFWTVTMLRMHKDMVNKSVSDYIEDYSTIIVPAILWITLLAICIFDILLPLIILMVIFLFPMYIISSVTENKCINGHTWIKDGEHRVYEHYSDKQFTYYLVADFKCSVCGIKKEEDLEKYNQQGHWK